jgi:hypothetical protein
MISNEHEKAAQTYRMRGLIGLYLNMNKNKPPSRKQ